MEQRFRSLSLFEFQERFSSRQDYLSYLLDLKWEDGFRCTINVDILIVMIVKLRCLVSALLVDM